MVDLKQFKGGKGSMHAMILGVVGLILVIVGIGIIAIPGAPMRGSGLGTASLLAGILILIIAIVRNKKKQ